MPDGPTTEGSIVAYLRLDASDWNRKLDEAEAKARELGRIDPTIRVDADTATALAKLEELKAIEDRTGGTVTTTTVSKSVSMSSATGSSVASDSASKADAVAVAEARLAAAEQASEMATQRALVAQQRLDERRDNSRMTAGQLAAAELAVQAAIQRSEAAALKAAAAEDTLAEAQKNTGETAVRESVGQEAAAAANDKAANSAGNNASRMGLIIGVVTAAIPLVAALSGAAFGLAGGMTAMGGAGVLAILGIKDEMSKATAEGVQYTSGLATAKTELTDLSDTAAKSMLPAFGDSLNIFAASMPWLNEEISIFSAQLGDGVTVGLQGVLNLFHLANPLFTEAGQEINAIAVGFEQWTQDGGLDKFVAYSEQQLPIVMSTLGSLAGTVIHVVTALAPLGTVALNALNLVTTGLNMVPVPVLTTLGTAALVTWGAFKAWTGLSSVFGLASAGLSALTGPTEAQIALSATYTEIMATEAGVMEALAASEDVAAASTTAVGTAMDVAMGPVGWVALGVTGLVAVFASISGAQQQATQSANDWAQALEADNYQIGQQSTALLAKQLHDTSQLQMAHELGISTQTYTAAVMGNGAALDQVNQKIAAGQQQYPMTIVASRGATQSAKDHAVAANDLAGKLSVQTKSMADGTKQAGDYKAAFDAANAGTQTALSITEQLAAAQDKARTATDQFAQALAGLGNVNLSATQANVAYMQSVADATAAVAKNGATLNQSTQAGRDNTTALDNIASSAIALISAQAKTGTSAATLTTNMQAARDSFIQTAEKMGATAAQAGTLADQYGLIPKNVSTAYTVSGDAAAQKKIDDIKAKLDALPRLIPVQIQVTGGNNPVLAGTNGGRAFVLKSGGGPIYRAGGGPAYLAGGGDPFQAFASGTDNVPAMLTQEEFVVRAPSARQNPGFLKAYNADPSSALAAVRGGGDITVTVVNKTGVTLSDLIDIQVQRNNQRQTAGVRAGKQKGAF
jgi:hypothetical protein